MQKEVERRILMKEPTQEQIAQVCEFLAEVCEKKIKSIIICHPDASRSGSIYSSMRIWHENFKGSLLEAAKPEFTAPYQPN